MKYSLYPLREEDSLVDTFVMEMLVVMIESLRLAHRDDKSLGLLYILFIYCVKRVP